MNNSYDLNFWFEVADELRTISSGDDESNVLY